MGLGASRPRAPDLRDGDFGVLPHLGVLLESTFARADGSGGGRGRLSCPSVLSGQRYWAWAKRHKPHWRENWALHLCPSTVP